MNNFVLILLIFPVLGCSNVKVLKIKRQLHNCNIEASAKDDIINNLYKELSYMNKRLKEKSGDLESSSIISSRLKLCRKDFLDCKVNKNRQVEYNNILKKQIESEVCNGR